MKSSRKLLSILLVCTMVMGLAVTAAAENADQVHRIVLSSQENGDGYTHAATLDGAQVPEYDYVWHADPTTNHDEVKNSPAEYHTGTEPTGEDPVYIAHDIYYYPELEQSKFQQVRYDGETEWVYLYEAEGYENYIFSTLPVLNGGFPSQMMHTADEAYENAVLHITEAGTYQIEGDWHGQIWIDLGDEDDVYANEQEKVTLILNGVNINCTVAPGLVFASVYECNNDWEDADHYDQFADTTEAGANVVLADGTVNNVSGTNIFRLLKTKYKDDDSTDAYPAQKKRLKIDAAFYSYQSMNITGGEQGTGVLNVTSGFEGLDSEMHLTINGGNVHIYSQDDGINVNEDGVSVVTVNSGALHICAGLGAEGDGIDSNGFLVINGGTVISSANPRSDSGLDSDCGSFVYGGTVVALGSTMDWAEADDSSTSAQPVMNLRFNGSQSSDEAIVITDEAGKVVFAYDPDKDEVTGSNQRTYQGAVVSAPGLTIGGNYQVYIGGDVEGTEASGVYDISTVTGFSNASRQCYSGNDVGGFGGGSGNAPGFGGGSEGDQGSGQTPPDNQQAPGEDGQNPFENQQAPGDGEQTPPEGRDEGQQQDPGQGSGGNPDAGFGGSQTGNAGPTCTYAATFQLSQQVNAFSGVTDYRHQITKVEAQAPTADSDGVLEHYACSGCGAKYADAEGSTPLSDQDVIVPATDPSVPSEEDPAPAPGSDNTLLIVALFFVGFALIFAGITFIILIRKNGKKTNE